MEEEAINNDTDIVQGNESGNVGQSQNVHDGECDEISEKEWRHARNYISVMVLVRVRGYEWLQRRRRLRTALRSLRF